MIVTRFSILKWNLVFFVAAALKLANPGINLLEPLMFWVHLNMRELGLLWIVLCWNQFAQLVVNAYQFVQLEQFLQKQNLQRFPRLDRMTVL